MSHFNMKEEKKRLQIKANRRSEEMTVGELN
jgi:hypothetical protein